MSTDEVAALMETLQSAEVLVPAGALGLLVACVLMWRALLRRLRPRRRPRRLDSVLPYAHAEPE